MYFYGCIKHISVPRTKENRIPFVQSLIDPDNGEEKNFSLRFNPKF
jgi:hypothetical protein